jgi:hypothetical protein
MDGASITVDVAFAPAVLLIVEADYLVVGTPWSASVNGTGTANVTTTVNGIATGTAALHGVSMIYITLPEGWYTISAAAPGYLVVPGSYYDRITPPSYGPVFVFKPVPGTLGLTVTPTNASLWVNGSELTLVHGSASWTGTPGFIPVEALAAGYYPYYSNITVRSGVYLNFTITLRPIEPGTLSLTVTPGSAYTYVDGKLVTLTSGVYSGSIAPGMHSIVVVAAGYHTYYNNVTVASNQTTALAVALVAVSTSSSGVSGINSLGWAIIVLLAVLAAIFLIGMLYFARRSRAGGGPPQSPPPQPWQETPPNSPPPSS